MAVPPTVWLLTDDKPGHRNQLNGLAQRLERLAGAHCHWLSVAATRVPLWQCLFGANLAPQLPPPDLAIAAGSGTQRALLATGRHFGCRTALLMKPNFPYRWLDAAIVPQHDRPPWRDDVLATRGALNAVVPAPAPGTERRGLMLVGGLSKHFGWNSAALVEQIVTLCREQPDWRWTLTDSRRTPADFLPLLDAAKPANLELAPSAATPPQWLPAQLVAASRVWVTPDSVSMVYEALTAGRPTGLFELPGDDALKNAGSGRIAQGLRQLLDDRLLTPFARRTELETAPRPQLWEADRAARWLLRRLFPDIAVSDAP